MFSQETLTKTPLSQTQPEYVRDADMRKTALSVALISALLFSAAAGDLFVMYASANPSPPETPPQVRINSDGSVEGTDGIRRSGNTYTFAGDISIEIVVLRDSIVIDGAGYRLRGSGTGSGLLLQDRSDVVIKNVEITNFQQGVKFTQTPSNARQAHKPNILLGNTITNNTYGVAFFDSSGGIEAVGSSLSVSSTSNVVFRNNHFENNGGAILEGSNIVNDIDTSNTVNGKPIYYWVGQHDKVVPSDAGWVALKNCRGIKIQGLKLEGNAAGILLSNSHGSIISGNVLTNNMNGVSLHWSSNNAIYDNHITGNSGYGIRVEYGSNDNLISKNALVANKVGGIQIESEDNTTISGNNVAENGFFGIYFSNIQNSKVIGNNVTLNWSGGIRLCGSNGTVRENYVAHNGKGIWLSNAVGNTITLNTVKANNDWGIELDGSSGNNVIHHNNFIDNKVSEGLQAHVAGTWTYPGLNNYQKTLEPPKLLPGAANAWDDGEIGNYWSDYSARYPLAPIFSSANVGSTPYTIDENNVDRYPLVNPWNANSTLSELPNGKSSGLELQRVLAFLALIGGVGLTIALVYLILKHRKKNRLRFCVRAGRLSEEGGVEHPEENNAHSKR